MIQLLAEALDLLVYESPVSSDWRWDAWFDYRRETDGVISGEGARLLNYLVDGRGLRSASVVGQGCYYAWLNSTEVESLVSELLEAEEGNPEIVELCEGFHEELLDSVAACRGHSLLLLAH